MTKRRNAVTAATIAFVLSAPFGSHLAQADELADLRANQELLQRRLDQLAQAQAPGNPYGVGGPPGPTTVQTMGGSFPRSFLIPGTDTSIRVGGEARLAILHWFDGGNPNGAHNTNAGATGQVNNIPLSRQGSIIFPVVLPPGQAALAPTGSARRRGENVSIISPQQSKISVETRTPTGWGEARTFIEFDFANLPSAQGNRLFAVSDNISLRLRFAYGTLGPWLAGQANSNFSDPDASMETLSFGGLVGDPGHSRIPQLRYTHPLAGWGLPGALSVSIEQPETELWTPTLNSATGVVVAGPSGVIGTFPAPAAVPNNILKSPAPDVTAAWYIPQPWGHVDFSAVVRPTLQVNDGAGTNKTYTGWGLHFGGDVKPRWFGWDRDFITWHVVGGDAIGSYMNIGAGNSGLGLVSNYTLFSAPANVLVKPVTSWGGNIGYRHYWAPNLRSNIGVGVYHEDINGLRGVVCPGGGPGSVVPAVSQQANRVNGLGGCGLNKELVTAAANLIWNPVPFVDVGMEYFWGHRLTVGNQRGDQNVLISRFRVQF